MIDKEASVPSASHLALPTLVSANGLAHNAPDADAAMQLDNDL